MSKPDVFLLVAGERWPLTVPFEGCAHAVAKDRACPACGALDAFGVVGKGRRISADDRAWEADGFATCCGAPVGLIRHEPSTIFGVREDAEVLLHGRARVY